MRSTAGNMLVPLLLMIISDRQGGKGSLVRCLADDTRVNTTIGSNDKEKTKGDLII